MPRARATAAATGLPATTLAATPAEAAQRLRNERAFRTALEADLIRGVYAVICDGDCMVPALPANGKILINADGRPRPGDNVAIHLREEAAARYGYAAAVKQLVIDLRKGDLTGPDGRRGIIAKMLNPPRALFFPAEDIVTMHRVVGPVPEDVQTLVVDSSYFDGLARAAAGGQ